MLREFESLMCHKTRKVTASRVKGFISLAFYQGGWEITQGMNCEGAVTPGTILTKLILVRLDKNNPTPHNKNIGAASALCLNFRI